MSTVTRSLVDIDTCAQEVLEVAPLACRWIRAAVRGQQPSWSFPQLQALGFLRRNPGASLSELAAQLGVGLSTASTLVTRLVSLGQVDRREDPAERRRILLRLTPQAEDEVEAALRASRDELAPRLGSLPPRDVARLYQALAVLRGLFSDA